MVQKAPKYKKPPIIPYEPIRFHFLLLTSKQKVRICALLVVSIVTGVLGIFSPIDYIWYISLVSFALGVIDLYSTYFIKNELHVAKSREVQELCQKLKPSCKEEKNIYKMIPLSDRHDAILMSYDVNKYIRSDEGCSVLLNLLPDRSSEIIRKHTANSELFKDLLIYQHFKSRGEGSMFFNDKKISLNSTLIPGISSIDVFESCYYLSYITNDLVTLNIENYFNREEPEEIWSGIDNFPYTKGHESAPDRILEIENTNMSNHIGGNTIAFTSNGKMLLWSQGKTALRSIGLLAPTGSGSLDFSDYEELVEQTLTQLAIRGMERELLEECHPQGQQISNFIKETKVIGYYRWVGKGGLPAFLGVTKLNVDKIVPNIAEVNCLKSRSIEPGYPAENAEQLLDSIKNLEKSARLSVPLRANLLALKEAICNDPTSIEFLFKE